MLHLNYSINSKVTEVGSGVQLRKSSLANGTLNFWQLSATELELQQR
ncbi:hypothetical protein IQ255_15780 [Pleurocapsales cyanobacterium LEGE 10410]|nr:hypothetical protein [Pleurocapsales cyanobacterium LEGE 10410]